MTRTVVCVAGLLGCKKPPPPTDDVIVLSTAPIPSNTPATLTTGIVNPGMADLTPQSGPITGPVTGMNPALIGGSASDPSVPPTAALPAKLPRDPGGAAPLKIVPMKIQFAVGRSIDNAAELQSDGTLLFDGRRVGKISGNKILIKKPANSLALRSDGFITIAKPKGTFFKQDAVGITLSNGFRVRGVARDISAIVSDAPGGGQFDYARANISLSDDKTRTTALMIATTEMSGVVVPPPNAGQSSMTTVAGGGAPTIAEPIPDGTYTFSAPLSGQAIPPPPPP